MENNKINSNPWLGLKTYDEGQHLYGREDDIHALSQNILFNIQTVIYGKSGIGKSSILNAGIFPILRKSNFFPCYIRLVHNQPNKSYNQQIWDRVLNSLLHLKREKLTADGTKEILSDIEGRYEELAPARDNESLWEIFHRHKFYDESNNVIQPVLVFDQFEEIFTREKDQEKVTSFFEELADLINNVVPETLCTISDVNITKSAAVDLDDDVDDLLDEGYEAAFADYLTESNFHIVLSLREDYLSYLERNIDNIPSLKHNRYCLKPLSEEQAASVIMHPCPGLISETVAKEIISKVTGSPVSEFELGDGAELEVDSAILSLFLHELYKKKPVDAKVIDYSIVNEFGDNIIQNFYEETISHISEDCAEYLERKLITEDGKRDSVYESHVINHKGYKASDLKYLKEQRLIREFPWNDGIRIEFIHDVLCPIIVQRKEERKQEDLQKQLLLEEELKRKEVEKEAAAEKLRLEIEAQQIREKNRKRIITIISSVAVILLMIFVVWYSDYIENEKLYEEYYADFENRDGWPVGIGQPLSEYERQSTPLYYKLSHRGNRNGNLHTDVEILSPTRYLPTLCRLPKLEWATNEDDDIKAKEYNEVLKNVVRVRYSSIEGSNEISKEELIDKDGKVLISISYFHLSANDAWAQFYTANGENMKIRDNCLDRMKLSWDSIGRIKSLMYYDAQGVPQDISSNKDVKGYIWEYVDNTTIRYALNDYGLPSNGLINNTIVTTVNDKIVEQKYLNSRKVGDKQAQEVVCEDGYSRSVFSNDSLYLFLPNSNNPYAIRHIRRNSTGQIINITTWGGETEYASKIVYEYEDGLLKKEEFLDREGAPYGKNAESIYKCEYAYNESGDIIEEKRINKKGELAYHYKVDMKNVNQDTVRVTETLDIRQNPKYLMEVDSITPTYTSTTFYGENHIGINKHVLVGNDSLYVHRIVKKPNNIPLNTIVSHEYYACENNKIIPLPTKKDEYGKAISYFRRITEYDKAGNIVSLKIEDFYGNIIKSMMYFIQNGQQIGRAVKGIDGNAVRCDKWEEEGYLYYKFYYSKDFEDRYSGLTAVDEWEHRSSIYDVYYDEYLYVDRYNFEGKSVRVYDSDADANKNLNIVLITPVYKTYKQVIFKENPYISNLEIPYIHVLSSKSKMYDNRNGVIDGDRIVAFEKWQLGEPLSVLEKEWKSSIGKTDIHVTILRPTVNSYIKKHLVLESDVSELKYIEYHVSKMTSDEMAFFKKYID